VERIDDLLLESCFPCFVLSIGSKLTWRSKMHGRPTHSKSSCYFGKCKAVKRQPLRSKSSDGYPMKPSAIGSRNIRPLSRSA
jgi:hypothetical protein